MKHTKEPTEIAPSIDEVKPEDFDLAEAHECQFCLKARATRVLKGPYWLNPGGVGLGERIVCLGCSAAQIATCNNLHVSLEIEEFPEGVPLAHASHLVTRTVVVTVPA
jgi:hypothetical protein